MLKITVYAGTYKKNGEAISARDFVAEEIYRALSRYLPGVPECLVDDDGGPGLDVKSVIVERVEAAGFADG